MDLIERQDAIDALDKIRRVLDTKEKQLTILPSAQPETHDKRTETHACDLISRQAAINALTSHIMPHNNEDGTVTIGVLSKSSIKNILNKLPSAQPDSKELSSTHKALDTISRQAAIDAHYEYCNKHPDAGFPVWSLKILEDLPSAQPELPEWAQKVEEYRKSAPSFVRNQLVWALYQTWKEYDGQLVHQRGKENR